MEQRRGNYQKILLRLERFASSNKEFYQYCMTNASYLDANYFTIGNNLTIDLERDEKFSTGFDSKLGRLLANELLKQHVFNLLNKVHVSGNSAHSKLIWTGQKTALVELIYALHASGSFNNGSTEINDIASALSSLFQISLGDFYRIFQDIGNRKTGQTKFLDELKSKLLQRINSNAE